MNRYKPRPQFVLERLRETRWEDRDRIAKLVALEGYARRGVKPGPNWMIGFSRLRGKFPVEWECIVREIEDGVRTPAAEYDKRRRAHEAELQRRREKQLRFVRQEQEREARAERARRRQWLKMGGLE